MKNNFNKFYDKKNIIEDYKGIEYIAYDEQYTEEKLEKDDYEDLKDEIDEVERFFKININVYTQDAVTKDNKNNEIGLTIIDRRSMTI